MKLNNISIKTARKLGVVAGVVAIIGLVGSIVTFVYILHQKPIQSNSSVCTTVACVKITEANGSVYYLNDFTFLQGNCIEFWSLPGNIYNKTCGDYQLKWVGKVQG